MSSRSIVPRRWFGRMTLLAIGLTGVIGTVLLHAVDSEGLDRLQRDVREATPLLSLIRLVVIAGLYLAWPSLLRFCTQRTWMTAETQQQLSFRRVRVAVWLIALELVLGLDVLNQLHALINRLTP